MQTALAEFRAFHEAFLPFVFEKPHVAEIFETAFLIRGHVLVEDLPGVGKTTAAKAFARLLGFSHARVQGTSDSLPQDVVGGEIFDFANREFHVRKGPVFEEVVLIDEINRMHPKTQSAFLECMEERSVSIAGKSHRLPEFHFVIATQNPLEHLGTFPLPEAQRDRFAAVARIGYPDDVLAKEILVSGSPERLEASLAALSCPISRESLRACRKAVSDVHLDGAVAEGLVRFANWTRSDSGFKYGISPRGLALFASALRAKAFLSGRDFVIPEDGVPLVVPFLSHRIGSDDPSFPSSAIE